MEIRQVVLGDLKDIAQIAFENLKNEASYVNALKIRRPEEIQQYLKKSMEKLEGAVYLEEGKLLGYLLYDKTYENKGMQYYHFPILGYGAITKERTKIMTRLFQYLGEALVSQQKVHFEVNIYAHDYEIIHLFSLMQFGIQCETGIRNMDEISTKAEALVREMSKVELVQRWQEVWFLMSHLIDHLRKSPIFYPGSEFTEAVYKDFFLDITTRVFVAEKENELIGIIEANKSSEDLLTSDSKCYNVGEVYVLPKYRGKGVSQALLSYTNDRLEEAGCNSEWVEHGSANPNARGFWNKYFKTYAYSLIREIEPVKI